MPGKSLRVIAGTLALAACNMGGGANRSDQVATANAARAVPPQPARKAEPPPAEARLDEIDAAPAPAARAKPGDVTRAWFAGSWTDSGDCADAGRFERNGTYLLADGTRGMWNVQDGRLVVQNAQGRSALRLRRVDNDIAEVVNEDGSLGRSTRCG